MTQTPMYMVPGVCLVDSNYSLGQPFNFVEGRYAKGRWASGNYYRFTAGFPEKIGGWVAFISAGSFIGIPRCTRPWLDYQSNIEIGIGTENHLYAYSGTTLTDITPKNLILTGTLTNPFTTSNGNATVAVADTNNKLVNGDWVFLAAGSAVGGLTIDGYYIVSSVVQGTGYNINAGLPATSNATGGGTTAFAYPRYNLTNPFATINGQTTVTVTDANHGAATGDFVTYSGATTFNGVNLNGQFQLTVVNSNSYTIQAPNAATGTGSGGGTVSVVHNISITSATIINSDPYGSNAYGLGPYGFSSTLSAIGQPIWTLQPYGNLLCACPFEGTIYLYDPAQGGVAFPLLNAPTGVRAMFVTPERFIIALGQASNPQTLAWPDQSVITNWTSSAVNTANSGRTVQGGSQLIGGTPVAPGVSLFFTDKSVFALEYTGDAEVYNSPLIADEAGLLAANAVVSEGGVAYWMGDADFWTYNGAVAPLPSDDVRDYVFNEHNSTALNLTYKSKTYTGMNRQKKEVWFFYVSQASTEIDSYVIYHYDQQCWSVGQIQRTTWVDSQLLPTPIATDALGNVFNQETGVDANGIAMNSYIQTGPIDLSNGETSMDIGSFTPDFKRLAGTVNLTVLARYYPQDTDHQDGPYAITAGDQEPIIDLRSDGRMVAALFTSNQLGGDWRLGLIKFDIKPAGARR
jgi:hypothetical protein